MEDKLKSNLNRLQANTPKFDTREQNAPHLPSPYYCTTDVMQFEFVICMSHKSVYISLHDYVAFSLFLFFSEFTMQNIRKMVSFERRLRSLHKGEKHNVFGKT